MIKNQWYAILPSKKVKQGKLLAVKRLNLELVLFRTSKGDIACVVDQCTHRGAALSLGKLENDCVRCPFHGIVFDKNGACKLVPANGVASRSDLSRFNLKHYPAREKHGIIYMWYGDSELATEELPFFEQYMGDDWVYSEIADIWNSHYSRSIENQLDVVHLPFVHYNTIGKGNKTLVNGPHTEFEDGILRTSANNEMDFGQEPKKPDAVSISDKIFLCFRFPNIWLNNISPKIKVFIYFSPIDEEHTCLYIRFYCKVSRIRLVNQIIAWFGKFANRTIERQDKRVVITQKPKASALHSTENLLVGDNPIVKYRTIREKMKQL